MGRAEDLKRALARLEGREYKAYSSIRGEYVFGRYTLYVDHVQGDPFASPSRVRVRVEKDIARFPEDTYMNRSREIALRDLIARKFHAASSKYSSGDRGTGKSGGRGATEGCRFRTRQIT